MVDRPSEGNEKQQTEAGGAPFRAPSISLPKGGGAIRGIGEKFAANPVTGTGSMTVPIATSPGRSGFGPQLSLSYDSGAGNGPFGFGWSLSLPSITRKTDKGLPQYHDADESDVFILSGAEDLVPVLVRTQTGSGSGRRLPPRTVDGITYRIHRYRPRIEGLFARIERWTNAADASDVSLALDLQGQHPHLLRQDTPNSRIADPADPTRIFSWLICETPRRQGQRHRSTATRRRTALGVDLDPGPRAQPRRPRRPARDGQPLPQAHPLRQPRAACWTTRAIGRSLADRTLPDRERRLDVRGRLRLRRARSPTRRRRTTPANVAVPQRSVLVLPRRLRGAHLPPLPAGADVPSLPGRSRALGSDCLVRSTDFTYSHEARPRQTPATPSTPFCAPSLRPATAATTAAIESAACRRSSSNTPSPSCRTRWRRSTPQAWRTCPSAWTARLPVDRPARRRHPRHPHRAGRRLVLQAQPQPDQRARRSNSRRWNASPPNPTSPWPAGRRSSWTWPATASPTWWCWTAPCPASTSTTTTKAGSPSAPSPRASTATCATRT